jgi:hypothetical protein
MGTCVVFVIRLSLFFSLLVAGIQVSWCSLLEITFRAVNAFFVVFAARVFFRSRCAEIVQTVSRAKPFLSIILKSRP